MLPLVILLLRLLMPVWSREPRSSSPGKTACALYHKETLRNMTEALTQARHEVIASRGEMTAALQEMNALKLILFSTNQELANIREATFQQQEDMRTFYTQMSDSIAKMKKIEAADCSAHFNVGRTRSGMYTVRPEGGLHSFTVYCDMESDGGGWTVIQRRGDYGHPCDFFYRTWDTYKKGFGELDREFWLGNERISSLTARGKYQLRIEMRDTKNNAFFAGYSHFQVFGENTQFKLNISGFWGNANHDSMSVHNGMRFSTSDWDNDNWSESCAVKFRGAWWYDGCYASNLNGRKSTDPHNNTLHWYVRGKGNVDLNYVQMKIRPKDF